MICEKFKSKEDEDGIIWKKYTDEDHKLSITQLQEKITIKKTEKDIEEYTNTSVEVFSGTEEEIEVNIY